MKQKELLEMDSLTISSLLPLLTHVFWRFLHQAQWLQAMFVATEGSSKLWECSRGHPGPSWLVTSGFGHCLPEHPGFLPGEGAISDAFQQLEQWLGPLWSKRHIAPVSVAWHSGVFPEHNWKEFLSPSESSVEVQSLNLMVFRCCESHPIPMCINLNGSTLQCFWFVLSCICSQWSLSWRLFLNVVLVQNSSLSEKFSSQMSLGCFWICGCLTPNRFSSEAVLSLLREFGIWDDYWSLSLWPFQRESIRALLREQLYW